MDMCTLTELLLSVNVSIMALSKCPPNVKSNSKVTVRFASVHFWNVSLHKTKTGRALGNYLFIDRRNKVQQHYKLLCTHSTC